MEATLSEVQTSSRADKAVMVPRRHDRSGAAMEISGWRFECKVSGKDTGGDLCVYDTVRYVKGGPPLHVHREQDEWFYVREGKFLFKVGAETFHVGPGDSVFGPRMVPHVFASLTVRSALIVAYQPAGGMEQLFFKAWEASQHGPLTPEDWRTFSAAHGVDIVGPPLEPR